ncbi:MAG: nitroreductase family protein [Lachnospiraceae bacterium]|nr:nitroreductase family protein [Lachnospiraceae bacterium]
MNLLDMLSKRRSIRTYTGEPIPKELLDQVLQAGLLSETSRGKKPWEFIVVRNKETLTALSQCRQGSASMLKNADCAIVVVGDETKTDVWTEDCSIAMAHMHLMADSLGLGSCWIQGRLRNAPEEGTTEEVVQKLLGIPKQYRLEAILSLGMISEHPVEHPIPEAECEKVHFEKF